MMFKRFIFVSLFVSCVISLDIDQLLDDGILRNEDSKKESGESTNDVVLGWLKAEKAKNSALRTLLTDQMSDAAKTCANSLKGCCWDNKHPLEQGCPPCEDSVKAEGHCKSVANKCNDLIFTEYMKKHCPVTCKFCDPQKACFDLLHLTSKCKEWKKDGKCDQQLIGSYYCKETCQKC